MNTDIFKELFYKTYSFTKSLLNYGIHPDCREREEGKWKIYFLCNNCVFLSEVIFFFYYWKIINKYTIKSDELILIAVEYK